MDSAFDYLAPPALPGALVEANLAGKKRIGAVWQAAADAKEVPLSKLKSVERVLEVAPLSAPFMQWIEWVAEYTLAPLGAVLSLAGLSFAAKTTKKSYAVPKYETNLPTLSPEQQKAYANLLDAKPTLLDGVTGSGKTEVYFHAIADALKGDGQVLVLLPEIALTHQWLDRFEKTFGAKPAMWHSRATPQARTRVWHAAHNGEAKVVVGARSALFLPYKKLSLIIVDEEHDPSYKQDDGVLYHARDMAIARAKFESVPIVLVSATPSLETLHNVAEGRYRAVHLAQRYGAADLPKVTLIDMIAYPPERGEFLSPSVKQKMVSTLEAGQQSLLFLNRRGYAPLLLCRGCGHRFECADCSAWLVVHGKQLQCHHCDHREPMPAACPHCKAPQEKLAPCGPGVERIAEEVRAMFPLHPPAGAGPSLSLSEGEGRGEGVRVVVLSSDESIAADTWSQIEQGGVDIIIGTQMVAKGHHFPKLTFVGVVDADLSLNGADLRAGERTYQLLHQLGGRAGRGDEPGEVHIQTYQSGHPVMKALLAHDRDALMDLESRERKAGGWPPYGQLAAILLDGVNEANVRRAGQQLAQSAPTDERIRVLGPAPAPLSKLRGQYRYRLLIKAKPGIALQKTLRAWLSGKKFSGVRVKMDVNPYYFQ